MKTAFLLFRDAIVFYKKNSLLYGDAIFFYKKISLLYSISNIIHILLGAIENRTGVKILAEKKPVSETFT